MSRIIIEYKYNLINIYHEDELDSQKRSIAVITDNSVTINKSEDKLIIKETIAILHDISHTIKSIL